MYYFPIQAVAKALVDRVSEEQKDLVKRYRLTSLDIPHSVSVHDRLLYNINSSPYTLVSWCVAGMRRTTSVHT